MKDTWGGQTIPGGCSIRMDKSAQAFRVYYSDPKDSTEIRKSMNAATANAATQVTETAQPGPVLKCSKLSALPDSEHRAVCPDHTDPNFPNSCVVKKENAYDLCADMGSECTHIATRGTASKAHKDLEGKAVLFNVKTSTTLNDDSSTDDKMWNVCKKGTTKADFHRVCG